MLKKTKNLSLGILAVLFCLNLLGWSAVFQFSAFPFLEVDFFDVGQGDAILITDSKFRQILIDGGPDSTILTKLARAMPFWDNTLDLVILSHPESDHLAGFIEVLKKYRVENVLWTGIKRETTLYKEWQEGIKKEKAKIFIAQAGQRVKFGKNFIDILYPFESLEGKEYKNSNDTSIVAKLVSGKNSFLFTGDISEKVEKELIKGGGLARVELDSDVLKIAHHGSKTSSSKEFLEKVSPILGIIQAGKNKYGLPKEEILEILGSFGIKVSITQEQGDIKIISDGNNIRIKNEK